MSPGARRTRAAGTQEAHQHNWEFFGPHGPLLLVPALPAVVLGLVYACNAEGCFSASALLSRALSASGSLDDWRAALAAALPGFPRGGGAPIYTHEAMAAALGWFLLTLLLHVVLPGRVALGAPLADGSGRRLAYKLNAFSVLCVTYGSALALAFFSGGGFGGGGGSSGAPAAPPPLFDLGWAADNFLPLATASIILSTALAVVVYAASFLPPGPGGVAAVEEGEADGGADDPNPKKRRVLSAHGATGVPWYDFWMGRELNPRVRLSPYLLLPSGAADCPLLPAAARSWVRRRRAAAERAPSAFLSSTSSSSSPAAATAPSPSSSSFFFTLDLKEFCELYPGMIGWALLNLSFAYSQSRRALPGEGVFGLGISNAMLLVNLFELWYVGDALLNERSILTTMDVTTDGFGFMLAFGDLCWVPFTFATQARFLHESAGRVGEQRLSGLALVGVLAVQAGGYFVFRGANGQKDAFRSDPANPSVAHLRSMPTRRGTRLLVSGWWGLARHVNYLGDWIMGLAWCLPTGVAGLDAAVPYFYALYFASLLAHRERRDDAACLAKYGREDWGRYCALVPWRIVPRVY